MFGQGKQNEESLAIKLHHAEQRIRELTKTVVQLKTKDTQSKMFQTDTQRRIEDLSEKLKKSDETICELMQAHSLANAKLKQMQAKLDESAARVKQVTIESENEVGELYAKLQTTEKRVKELLEAEASSNTKLVEMQSELQETDAQLRQHYADSQRQLDDFSSKLLDSERKCNEMEAKLKEADLKQLQRVELQKVVDELCSNLRDAQEKIMMLEQVKAAYGDSQRKIEEVTQKLQQTEQRNAELEDMQLLINNERASVKESLKEAEGKLKKIQLEHVDDLTSQLKQTRQRIIELEEINEAVGSEWSMTQLRLKEAEDKLAESLAGKAGLKSQIDSISAKLKQSEEKQLVIEESLRISETERLKLDMMLKETSEKLKSSESAHASSQAFVKELSSKLKKAEQSVLELEKTYELIQTERSQFLSMLKGTREKLAESQGTQDVLQNEVKELASRLQHSENMRESYKANLRESETKLKQSQDAYAASERRVEELSTKLHHAAQVAVDLEKTHSLSNHERSAAEASLVESNTRLEALQQLYDDSQNHVNDLTTKLKDAIMRIYNMKEGQAQSRASRLELEAALTEARDKLLGMEVTCGTAQTQVEELSAKLKDAEVRIQQLQAANALSKKDAEELSAKLMQAEERVTELLESEALMKAEQLQVEAKLKNIEENFIVSQAEVNEWCAKLGDAEKKVTILAESEENASVISSQLLTRLKDLEEAQREERFALQQEHEDLIKKLDVAAKEADQLNSSLKSSNASALGLQAQLEKEQLKLQETKGSLERAESELLRHQDKSRADAVALSEKLQDAERKVSEANSAVQLKDAKILELSGALESSKSDAATLRAELKQRDEIINQQQSKCLELERCQKQLLEMQTEIMDGQTKAKHLQAKLKECETELQRCRSSNADKKIHELQTDLMNAKMRLKETQIKLAGAQAELLQQPNSQSELPTLSEKLQRTEATSEERLSSPKSDQTAENKLHLGKGEASQVEHDLQVKLAETEKELSDSKCAVARLEEELNAAQHQMTYVKILETQRELKESEDMIKHLQTELEETSNKLCDAQQKILLLETYAGDDPNQGDGTERMSARQLEDTLQGENDSLRSELADLQEQLSFKETLVADLERYRDLYRETIQRNMSELSGADVQCPECIRFTRKQAELLDELKQKDFTVRKLDLECKTLKRLVQNLNAPLKDGSVDEKVSRLKNERDMSLTKATKLSLELAESRMRIDELAGKLQDRSHIEAVRTTEEYAIESPEKYARNPLGFLCVMDQDEGSPLSSQPSEDADSTSPTITRFFANLSGNHN